VAAGQRSKLAELRTRILVLAWLFSILPLAGLYLIFGQVLSATRARVAEDAGAYSAGKTKLAAAAIDEELAFTLRRAAKAARASGSGACLADADREAAVAAFLRQFAEGPETAFLFDGERKLLGASAAEPALAAGASLEDAAREFEPNAVTVVEPLAPSGCCLLLAFPRSALTARQRAALRFGSDFAGDIKTRFNNAVVELRLSTFLSFVALCLFALLLARWLTNILTRPLQNLAAAMATFDGQTPVSLPTRRRDEIGALTERFGDMTVKLVETRRALETKQAALEKADEELMRLNLHLEKHISERTADLEAALTRLRELDKNKDDFLSLVSHELKTPLTSITASAEALLAKDLPLPEEGRTRFLEIIGSEARRLTRLINDLLDLTSLEAGRIQLHFQPTDLYELVRRTTDAYRLSIHRKGLAFDVTLANDPRLRKASTDADRVAQVVTNLLGNAIKFTERGHISLSLDVALDDGEPAARMVVADTGIGIRPEDAHKVFDRFQQIEQIDTHHEGVGLGMPISRMIVEALGGEIHFTSKPGHGATFYVSMPLQAREKDRDKA